MPSITFLVHFAQHKTPLTSELSEDMGQRRERNHPSTLIYNTTQIDIYHDPFSWSNSQQYQLIPGNITPSPF